MSLLSSGAMQTPRPPMMPMRRLPSLLVLCCAARASAYASLSDRRDANLSSGAHQHEGPGNASAEPVARHRSLVRRQEDSAARARTIGLGPEEHGFAHEAAAGPPEVLLEASERPSAEPSLLQREVAFFKAVEKEIKQSWFLHGDPVLVVMGARPYLLKPSSDSPVSMPADIEKGWGRGITDPAELAKEAHKKDVTGLAAWFENIGALQNLIEHPSENNVFLLSRLSKVRGFLNGEEQTEKVVRRMPRSELMAVGFQTFWLRGGMGIEGIVKKALAALPEH
mmetsp:Transcript_59416/g.165942  ORF Transcript_59416/g.165942 Transcript_59416/m.165942 type:complete len:281 (-) Transcript_59416:93-935(-)